MAMERIRHAGGEQVLRRLYGWMLLAVVSLLAGQAQAMVQHDPGWPMQQWEWDKVVQERQESIAKTPNFEKRCADASRFIVALREAPPVYDNGPVTGLARAPLAEVALAVPAAPVVSTGEFYNLAVINRLDHRARYVALSVIVVLSILGGLVAKEVRKALQRRSVLAKLESQQKQRITLRLIRESGTSLTPKAGAKN